MRRGYRTIIVPVDFSAGSRAALRELERLLPSGVRVQIHLVHVLEPLASLPPPIWGNSPEERKRWRHYRKEHERRARRQLERIAARLPRALRSTASVVVHVLAGSPYATICRFAGELRADLIVIGTHGRTGLKGFLLGSVAERVLRRAGRPVLAVPLHRRLVRHANT
jgi:nucleotide-binding universal stress UspA family protein